jgi:hypothetical protein
MLMLFFDQTFAQNQDVFNSIMRLSKEEIADPYLVVNEFFDRYTLSEIRRLFYNLHRVAITTENTEFVEPINRSNMQFKLESIEQLIEAASLLQTSH